MPNWRSLPLAIYRWALGFVKRHYILSPLLGIVLLLVIFLLWSLFKPVAPQYITAVVKRGDLVQKVEAVGTITSDRDLNLKFPTTGIIADVLVKEGDKVTAGQELAKLRNDALLADVASAAAQLASAQASLQELKEGTRPEDLAIARADVANKRAALQAARTTLAGAQEKRKVSEQKLTTLKQEASVDLATTIESATSNGTKYLTTADNALKSLDDVFIGDPIVSYYVEFFSQSAYLSFRAAWIKTQGEIDALLGKISGGFADYQQAVDVIREARGGVADATDVMNQAYDLIASLPLTDNFSVADREAHKTTITTGRTNTQTALSGLDTSLSTLQTSTASYDTLLATEEATFTAAKNAEKSAEADIATYEATLRSQEAELALKIAGPRSTTIDVARASVNSAYASLSRARARMEDSIIRTPADGTITKVDFKLGEFTGDPDNASHSITMLGTSPFRVEMFLSEVDIPKVILTQSGSIELDAFPGTHYALHVSGVEPGPTKIEGVSKYRVNLNFVYPHEEFKIGMTGDAEIITGERKDVLLVPARAVIQSNDNGKIVRILENDTVTEKPVTIGMESDTDAEVVSGLTEGETVVVLIKK